MPTERWTVFAGWNILDIDRSSGGQTLDLQLAGPVAGVQFDF